MDLRIKLLEHYKALELPIPQYATEGAAGIDLRAAIKEAVWIGKGNQATIPSGIIVEIPKGFAGFIYPRSGLSTKHGIKLANDVGVIDSDYRGEIGLPMINHGFDGYYIKPGDRIAQLVIQRIAHPTVMIAETLSETKRGSGGFGHTGAA